MFLRPQCVRCVPCCSSVVCCAFNAVLLLLPRCLFLFRVAFPAYTIHHLAHPFLCMIIAPALSFVPTPHY